jgi:hypothetical protein
VRQREQDVFFQAVFRVAAVRFFRIVEVNHEKLRLYPVLVEIVQQRIISDYRKVDKLVIIQVCGKSFGNMLFYVTVYHIYYNGVALYRFLYSLGVIFISFKNALEK